MKNFDFDNDTGKNIISDPYIYYTASDRLQGEEQFQQKVFSLNQMSDIREVWKYWPLKDGFRLISQGRHFVVGGPKSFKLLADICFENSLQNTVLPSLLLFLCAFY